MPCIGCGRRPAAMLATMLVQSGDSMSRFHVTIGALALAGASLPAMAQSTSNAPPGFGRIEHVIVVYMENHSFDNLFGDFPGADGRANAGTAAIPVDRDGTPYKTLPPVFNAYAKPP